MASAAETALTSVSRIKLKNLVEEGDKKALEIENLISKPNIFLSTILVVNSVAVIIASSMTTVLALRFIPDYGELIGTIFISRLYSSSVKLHLKLLQCKIQFVGLAFWLRLCGLPPGCFTRSL